MRKGQDRASIYISLLVFSIWLVYVLVYGMGSWCALYVLGVYFFLCLLKWLEFRLIDGDGDGDDKKDDTIHTMRCDAIRCGTILVTG